MACSNHDEKKLAIVGCQAAEHGKLGGSSLPGYSLAAYQLHICSLDLMEPADIFHRINHFTNAIDASILDRGNCKNQIRTVKDCQMNY
jgi:hypothetical protein